MNIIANTKDMSREDWLTFRKMGIGGSDAAAVCGLNKYKSPIGVWMDKLGKSEERPDNEAMRVGRDLEDYVAKRFQEATGKKVRRKNQMMCGDGDDSFMLANVDRVIVGENALLECKTANAYGAQRWADGQCPAEYEIQCMHYMAVTGADRVYLACLIMGIDFVIRVIERDEEMIQNLKDIERRFWFNHVMAAEMPAPDGSDADAEAIKMVYAVSDPEACVTIDDSENLMHRYDEINELIDELEREQEAIKQEWQAEMKEAEVAFVGDRKITWKTRKGSVTLDRKKLKAEHPEIFEQYQKVGKPSRVFKVEAAKKEA